MKKKSSLIYLELLTDMGFCWFGVLQVFLASRGVLLSVLVLQRRSHLIDF